MKVLVTYGWHKKEYKFGKLIHDKYNSPFGEDERVLDFIPLTNSSNRSEIEEKVVEEEVNQLIIKYKPRIHIDIHHGFSICDRIDLSDNLTINKKKNYQLEKLIDRFLRFGNRRHIKEKTSWLSSEICFPIHILYWNAFTDKGFAEYLFYSPPRVRYGLKRSGRPNGELA